MKSSYKIINLSDGASVYTIGPEDNVSRILLSGGSIALDRTVDINWSAGNNAAPLDTMLIINKTLSIQPNSVVNGVKVFSHILRLFGYQMPNDVKEYGDMIVCVKVANDKWKISSFTAINFFGAGGGGTGIGIDDPGTVDIANGMVGFNQKPISINLTDLVDNSTIKIVGGKLVGNTASDLTVSVMDDFVDSTSKEIVNGAISGDIGGTALITADLSASYSGSIADKETQISRTTNPILTTYLRFKARGNSEIKIGVLDDFTKPLKGAYFKLSGTSYEVFTVVNDGTERIVTSGVSVSLGPYIKFEIVLRDNGNVLFYINNVLVREETGYAIPDVLYKQSVSVASGSAETLVEVDYMKIQMTRV